MTDSNILNENGNVVANTPTEVVKTPSAEVEKPKTDSNENVENTSAENANVANANVANDNTNESIKENNVENSAETNAQTTVEDYTEDDAVEIPPTSTEPTEAVTVPLNPRDDDMKLLYLDKDFVYDCMSVPTHSKLEYRMVVFIILWARKNGIKYEFDDFGNVYLTKGKLAEGEYYPCVTSHLDTVQTKHDPYIYAGVPLDLKTERTKDGSHKISVDANGGSSIGIGADDKGGVCICLSLFNHLDKLKACFFLDEETGCHGSDELWKEWFNDVGYVIGYDSPDLYRAAWACSGTKLFSYEFYEKHMKEVCDRWGLTKGCFFSEPYTDVKNIREKVEVICMNFGNGGYYAHSENEYCIIEDMDQACGMGVDLIESIGCTRHYLKHGGNTWANRNNGTYVRNNDGTYKRVDVDDTTKLESLGDNTRKNYFGYGSGSTNTNTNTTTTHTTKKEDEIKFETVKYIVNRYEGHINSIKEEVLEAVKDLCVQNHVLFDVFETAISEKFNNEIKF
jgi:hypothetical protein